MPKELAMDASGNLSYCSVPPDQRGTKGCTHSAHANPGESNKDFVSRIESKDNDGVEMKDSKLQDYFSSVKQAEGEPDELFELRKIAIEEDINEILEHGVKVDKSWWKTDDGYARWVEGVERETFSEVSDYGALLKCDYNGVLSIYPCDENTPELIQSEITDDDIKELEGKETGDFSHLVKHVYQQFAENIVLAYEDIFPIRTRYHKRVMEKYEGHEEYFNKMEELYNS